MKRKILFVDRDGTLIEEPQDCQVDSLAKVSLVAGVIPAMLRLRDAGYRFVMVSNQDGLGSAAFPLPGFEAAHRHVLQLFESQGIVFDEIFICPHLPEDQCDCRKPRSGLLSRFLASTEIDTEASAVVGDRDTDLQLADNIGLRGFLVRPSGSYDETWDGVRAALISRQRSAIVERTTRETAIRACVNLDEHAPVSVSTGIGFYDHMLEQIAKHGGFSLQLQCSGDLRVDEHHTVEDTALCIGGALREALGDKRGIARYGFLLPMDESEAQVALDLSGRASFAMDGDFGREAVGGLPTELVSHFFRSLADTLGAALHIRVTGDNAHHMVEACFKAVGRALRQAIRVEGDDLPTTKGTLG